MSEKPSPYDAPGAPEGTSGLHRDTLERLEVRDPAPAHPVFSGVMLPFTPEGCDSGGWGICPALASGHKFATPPGPTSMGTEPSGEHARPYLDTTPTPGKPRPVRAHPPREDRKDRRTCAVKPL